MKFFSSGSLAAWLCILRLSSFVYYNFKYLTFAIDIISLFLAFLFFFLAAQEAFVQSFIKSYLPLSWLDLVVLILLSFTGIQLLVSYTQQLDSFRLISGTILSIFFFFLARHRALLFSIESILSVVSAVVLSKYVYLSYIVILFLIKGFPALDSSMSLASFLGYSYQDHLSVVAVMGGFPRLFDISILLSPLLLYLSSRTSGFISILSIFMFIFSLCFSLTIGIILPILSYILFFYLLLLSLRGKSSRFFVKSLTCLFIALFCWLFFFKGIDLISAVSDYKNSSITKKILQLSLSGLSIFGSGAFVAPDGGALLENSYTSMTLLFGLPGLALSLCYPLLYIKSLCLFFRANISAISAFSNIFNLFNVLSMQIFVILFGSLTNPYLFSPSALLVLFLCCACLSFSTFVRPASV